MSLSSRTTGQAGTICFSANGFKLLGVSQPARNNTKTANKKKFKPHLNFSLDNITNIT
jgi:hypothetical protein